MPYIKDMGGKPTQHTLHTLQMRKIERQMNTAVQRATDWSSVIRGAGRRHPAFISMAT